MGVAYCWIFRTFRSELEALHDRTLASGPTNFFYHLTALNSGIRRGASLRMSHPVVGTPKASQAGRVPGPSAVSRLVSDIQDGRRITWSIVRNMKSKLC